MAPVPWEAPRPLHLMRKAGACFEHLLYWGFWGKSWSDLVVPLWDRVVGLEGTVLSSLLPCLHGHPSACVGAGMWVAAGSLLSCLA